MLPPDANRPTPLPRTSRPVTQAAFPELPAIPAPLPPPAEPAPANPPGLSSGPTLGGLFAALRRRLLLAVAVATAGAALTVLAVFLLVPAMFVAQSQIKLSSRANRGIITEKLDNEDPVIWKANQEGILKSPAVLDRALRTARAKGINAPYSPDGLAKSLKVDFLLGPEIMRVVLIGDDGETVAPLMNEIVQAYLDQVRDEEVGRRNDIIRELEKTQGEYRKKLREYEKGLRKEEKNLNYDPEMAKQRMQIALGSRQASSNSLLLLQTELAKKERELRTAQAREKNIAGEVIPFTDIVKHLSTSPAVQGLLNQIKLIDDRIADIKSKVVRQKQAKELRLPLEEKQDALRVLERLYEELRPGAEQELRAQLHQTLRNDILRLQNEVNGLKIQEESAALALKRIDDEIKRLEPNNLPRSELMDKLRGDIAQVTDALSNVDKEINKLKVEPVAASRAQILQRAARPNAPDNSRRVKLGGAAGVGVFGMLLFGVAFLEFRNRKVNSPDEVGQGLGLNVLGTLPALPPRLRRPMAGNASAGDLRLQNQMAEAVDALRTVLLHQAKTSGTQVVMVTSATGGEGKTSLASQLAASLARSWRKTLLVDGDLRNPAAHKLFDVPLEPGLSEVLRGEATPGDVVRPTPLSRLWMVPAGHWDSHAVQALAQDGVRATISQLSSQYEFVIVDSCPVLPVADALLLAQHVDGVIFTVLRDVSRLPAVHAAHQRLRALGVRVLGAVMIGAGGEAAGAGYQYPAPGNG